jgi:hypothetical protein
MKASRSEKVDPPTLRGVLLSAFDFVTDLVDAEDAKFVTQLKD